MLLAADWWVTGGILKIVRRIWEVGVAGSPVIGRRRGAFSTLQRRPGLRASSDGVLATKSEGNSEYMLVLAVCLVCICNRHSSSVLLMIMLMMMMMLL